MSNLMKSLCVVACAFAFILAGCDSHSPKSGHHDRPNIKQNQHKRATQHGETQHVRESIIRH